MTLVIRSLLGSKPIALLRVVSRNSLRLIAAGLQIGFPAVIPLRTVWI
jgi:hypothetical protein